jgi:acyl-CoA thioesterase-2
MPDVPPPESIQSELEILRERQLELPASLRAVLTQDRPLDFRSVAPRDPINHAPGEPLRQVWFKCIETLPNEPIVHQAILAYASDYGMLPTALLPHDVSYRDPRLMLASLDHTLWMHRDFRADDWLLYSIDSPSASGARGFVRGQVFTRDGRLVASVAQEGLIRVREAR